MQVRSFCSVAVFALAVCAASVGGRADDLNQPVQLLTTPDGVEYGLWGDFTSKPAPTLIVLSATIEESLSTAYFRQCGNHLADCGYVLVSIDLPCHGKQALDGAPVGLSGWSKRVANNEEFVIEANERLSKVLDHLIANGVTDPQHIAVCGTSRGGFLAIHFAAHDARVKCVAGFAPVTDLAVLREFEGQEGHELLQKLSLANQVERLMGRPVWIMIGDRDDRVGTSRAYELACQLSAVARENDVPSQVELHIVSEPRGHTTPRIAPEQAAVWIHRQLTGQELPASKSSEPHVAAPHTDTITQHETMEVETRTTTPYLLYHPGSETLPEERSLLIYLYGAGGSIGNYNFKRPPYALLREQLAMRGYYVVVPELGTGHFMNDAAKAKLDSVVADVLKQQQIPNDRVHVMGTSMGAGSSLAYAIHRPELIQSVCAVMPMTDFAAWVVENPKYVHAIAAAFGGTYQQVPEAYRRNSAVNNIAAYADIPVMMIHGTADKVVQYEQSRRLSELLKRAGYLCDLCTVEDNTHRDDVMNSFQLKAVEFFDAAF